MVKILNKFKKVFAIVDNNQNQQKIFCIGRNKTGTTSLENVLKEFGYELGDQTKAELLIKDYKKYNWKPIIEFCKTADAFQDAPFSWPYTWLILQEHFPNSKFILTYRDKEDWYNSLTKFHSKLFTGGERIPIKEDLINAKYRYKGFIWEVNRSVYKTPENNPYQKSSLIKNYQNHNEAVMHFFKNNDNFLALDVSKKGSYKTLCDFLGKSPLHEEFPHLNKTS